MKNFANFGCETICFADRNSRRKVNIDPHRSFVKFWKEFGTELPQTDNACRQQDGCEADHDAAMFKSRDERRSIKALASSNDDVLCFRNIPAKQEVAE